jgi:alginate O-acetyltransferase complex protein AlgJ
MHDQEPFRFSRVFAAAFLLIATVGVIFSFRAVVSPEVEERLRGTGGSLDPVLDGSWTSSFQSGFEEAVAFREGALVLWAAGRYALFRSGAPGVVVGQDGWLFTAEEFETHPNHQDRLLARLAEVAAVRDSLKTRGIDLVVALVPSKARQQPEHLRHNFLPRRPPALLADRYSTARAFLRKAGIPAPDLRSALGAGGSYLRRDTHWTPAGSAAVARLVAVPGRDVLDRNGVRRTAFESIPVDRVSHTGDLMTFLPLGPYAERFGLGPEEVRLFETRLAPPPRQTPPEDVSSGNGDEDPLGLFATPTIPVALVGTSYSADPRWNFAGFLQEALEAEVLTVAEEGKGPFQPMEAYLSSDTIAEIPPSLVIWEIPERYLTVEPE